MSDWKIVCLKCGTTTTYQEMAECGHRCPNCGNSDFKVSMPIPKSNHGSPDTDETQIAS